MRFRFQNLNDKVDGTTGSIFKHGRSWFYFGKNHKSIGLEWANSFSPKLGFQVTSGAFSDHYITCRLSLVFTTFYISLSPKFLKKFNYWAERRNGFESGLMFDWNFFGPILYFDIATKMTSWSSKDRWWNKGLHINLIDLLLGRKKLVSEKKENPKDVIIPMPEGSYTATLTKETRVYGRPRWFSKTRNSIWVDIPKGIPHAGKGENSWDCGDDALHGCGVEGFDENAAIANCVKVAMDYRKKYGAASHLYNTKPIMAN